MTLTFRGQRMSRYVCFDMSRGEKHDDAGINAFAFNILALKTMWLFEDVDFSSVDLTIVDLKKKCHGLCLVTGDTLVFCAKL